MLGGAFGLANLHFIVGRISDGATPSDKNDEFTRNNLIYLVSDINNCFILKVKPPYTDYRLSAKSGYRAP
jgi:hypothetical protein